MRLGKVRCDNGKLVMSGMGMKFSPSDTTEPGT